MDALIAWMLHSPTGSLVASTLLFLLGLGIWANLMLLASYVPRQAMPIRVAILIVLGVGAGAGAVHSAVWGALVHGAVYAAAASGIVMVLLICVVGTPKQLSGQYCQPIDRGRWWSSKVVQPVANIKERVSNWGELHSPRAPKGRQKDR